MSAGHVTRWILVLIHVLLLLVLRTEGEVVEGDIEDDGSTTSMLISFEPKIWPKGIVPYVIDSDSVKENALAAMLSIEERTKCINFIPKDPRRTDYINITSTKSGCSSSVAPKGGGQLVIIGPGCNTVGIIIHELLHALGFWHEHSRPDRDEYIQLFKKNMIEGTEDNFKIRQMSKLLLSVKYDYYSILHYKYNEFAKTETLATIEPLDKSVLKEALGQRERLSFYDVRKIRKLYNCLDYDRKPSTCSPPHFDDVMVILPDSVLEVGLTVKYLCPESLSLIGPQNSTCQQTLTWPGAVPFCANHTSTSQLTYCDMADCLSTWSLPKYKAYWKRHQGVSDHTYGNNGGSYLSTENLSGSNNYALAITPWMNLPSGDVSIMFYYNMSGSSKLSVHINIDNNWKALCTCEKDPENNQWHQSICINANPKGTRARVAFLASSETASTSSVSIDDFVFGASTEIKRYEQHIKSTMSQGKPPEYDEFEQ